MVTADVLTLIFAPLDLKKGKHLILKHTLMLRNICGCNTYNFTLQDMSCATWILFLS